VNTEREGLEADAARPNDRTRAVVLELLDVADRAGVALSCITVNVHGGRVTAANMHGAADNDERHRMTYMGALRIALRLSGRDGIRDADEIHILPGSRPYVAMRVRHVDVDVTIFCEPTPAMLEAATVAAALQS
jgi:hypothetical protein